MYHEEAPLECRQKHGFYSCRGRCRISSDSSLSMMRVHSMAFCGKDDSYVAVDFDKDGPRQHRAMHWRSDSLEAHLLPSLELGLQASQTKGPSLGVCSGGHFEIMERCKGKTLCWVHATEPDSVEQPHVEPLVGFQGSFTFSRSSLEGWCFSSDGTLLAAVTNWEDADQREAPSLKVYDLRPFLTALEAWHTRARARALRPLRTFVRFLSLREQQVAEIPSEMVEISSGAAEIPSLMEELRLEEGRPGTGTTMESQSGVSSGAAEIPSLIEELRLEEGRPGIGTTTESQSGVISDALAAVFGNASLVELIESWLLQDLPGPKNVWRS